jgi:hypothetical protein
MNHFFVTGNVPAEVTGTTTSFAPEVHMRAKQRTFSSETFERTFVFITGILSSPISSPLTSQIVRPSPGVDYFKETRSVTWSFVSLLQFVIRIPVILSRFQ